MCSCAFFSFLFPSFFPTRRMFKLTLVIVEWGETMGLSNACAGESKAEPRVPPACIHVRKCTQGYGDRPF